MHALRAAALLSLFLVPCLSADPPPRRRSVGPADESRLTATEWLRKKAVPFRTADARTGVSDLEPLRSIVGSARIVSLGEATHGTREFFTMKHRVLEFLVEEMGFTVFAIEANLPESDRVDDYVMKGEGSAGASLSSLYVWTWNTCLAGQSYSTYPNLSRTAQDTCRANVGRAYDLVAANRDRLVGGTSLDAFERHLRYARVIVQAESFWARRGNRDAFMAENVEWLADTLHPTEEKRNGRPVEDFIVAKGPTISPDLFNAP